MRHKKNRKHLAEALIISKTDYGNIIYSNASQNYLMQLQKLLKATCSFVNGSYSKSRNLRNKDEFLIINYDENCNTFIGMNNF